LTIVTTDDILVVADYADVSLDFIASVLVVLGSGELHVWKRRKVIFLTRRSNWIELLA
jgi:hypothetical protein